jgi:ketosteroid isomerase-like protein
VQITHTPPMGNDETVDGATLGPNEVALFEEMVRLVPDYRQEDVDVRVDGDEIVVDETLVGTLPDGTVHRAPLRYRFTIENGRIVKTNGIYDAAVVAPFGRVVAAAGHRTPDKMS